MTAPMSTVNAIAVEAYKKYISVSLIHHGQVCSAIDIYFMLYYVLRMYGQILSEKEKECMDKLILNLEAVVCKSE